MRGIMDIFNSALLFFNGLAITFTLEDTACYGGLLLAPAEGLGLPLRIFFPLGQKRAYYAVWPILGYYWCPVATLVTFRSNLSNLKKKKKKLKKTPKNKKIS